MQWLLCMSYSEGKRDLFIYLFNNIYTGSKYQLQKLFFQQSPV